MNEIKRTVAKNIKKFREKKGLTQGELAAKIGTTNKNVSNWENEVSSPDMNLLHKIALTLDTDMNEIFLEDGSLFNPENYVGISKQTGHFVNETRSAEFFELQKFISSLSDEAIRELKTYAEFLVQKYNS